jgi:hypothetical protein
VLDEAHRLRNVYKTSNVIAKALKEALSRVHSKVLLTATPLQNSLLELYGLVSFIDDRVFGDLDSFRSQFTAGSRSFSNLSVTVWPDLQAHPAQAGSALCVVHARKAIVQEFTPTSEEQANCPTSSPITCAAPTQGPARGSAPADFAGAVEAARLQHARDRRCAGDDGQAPSGCADEVPEVPDLADELDEDYESLDETAEEWSDQGLGRCGAAKPHRA